MDITLSTYINIQQTQEDLFTGWTMQLQGKSDDNFAFITIISLLDSIILG